MLQQFNQKNRDLIVNIDGRLVHRDEAGISPFDSVVQAGDAVWEGLRLYNGRIFKLYEHLDRLHRSAVALSFPEIPPREKIIEEIKRTLAANRMRDGVHVRLTVREDWTDFDHEQNPPAASGDPGYANSSREFAQLDPGQN